MELYLDDGDGVENTLLDSFINFTVTGGGGYYIFPEIPARDYFAVFELPAGYVATFQNQGGDDNLDSDGVLQIAGADSLAFMPITTISTNDIARSWDLGLTTSLPTVEICENGQDDDGDGLTDYLDPDCPCCKANAPNLNGLNKE